MVGPSPLLFLQPMLTVAFSVALLAYWRRNRRLTVAALLFSAAAYAGSIFLKVAVQSVTAGPVISAFGYVSVPAAIYLGIQTSVFEVGLAYLVARFAVSKKRLTGDDADGYGISLAFWENGVLLGLFGLVNVAALFAAVTSTALPQSARDQLISANPSLLLPAAQLLPLAAWATLERVSSLLLHFSWGYLSVIAAYVRRRAYFVLALPMGMVDALVPLVRVTPIWQFETLLFCLSLGALLVSWRAASGFRLRSAAPPGAAAVRSDPA